MRMKMIVVGLLAVVFCGGHVKAEEFSAAGSKREGPHCFDADPAVVSPQRLFIILPRNASFTVFSYAAAIALPESSPIVLPARE